MNQFKYVAYLKKIESTKLVKDLEIIVRELCYKIDKRSFKEDIILNYKLYTFALNKFKEKSSKVLPDFIYNNKAYAHRLILDKFFKEDSLPAYELLINTFEFDELISLPINHDYLPKIDKVIGDSPMPFRIDWTKTKLTSFDSSSTEFDQRTQKYLVGLRYKQVNFPNSNRPVIESYLAYYRSTQPPKQEEINAAILLLEQQINAIKGL